MTGWQRSIVLDATTLPWVMPSRTSDARHRIVYPVPAVRGHHRSPRGEARPGPSSSWHARNTARTFRARAQRRLASTAWYLDRSSSTDLPEARGSPVAAADPRHRPSHVQAGRAGVTGDERIRRQTETFGGACRHTSTRTRDADRHPPGSSTCRTDESGLGGPEIAATWPESVGPFMSVRKRTGLLTPASRACTRHVRGRPWC